MNEMLFVEVAPKKSLWPFVVLKVLIVVPVLFLSLVLYLAGIFLTLTIIGAVVGIPLILATYGLDALVLVMLINLKEAAQRVSCPGCGRKKTILLSVMDEFTCKRCKEVVTIRKISKSSPPKSDDHLQNFAL